MADPIPENTENTENIPPSETPPTGEQLSDEATEVAQTGAVDPNKEVLGEDVAEGVAEPEKSHDEVVDARKKISVVLMSAGIDFPELEEGKTDFLYETAKLGISIRLSDDGNKILFMKESRLLKDSEGKSLSFDKSLGKDEFLKTLHSILIENTPEQRPTNKYDEMYAQAKELMGNNPGPIGKAFLSLLQLLATQFGPLVDIFSKSDFEKDLKDIDTQELDDSDIDTVFNPQGEQGADQNEYMNLALDYTASDASSVYAVRRIFPQGSAIISEIENGNDKQKTLCAKLMKTYTNANNETYTLFTEVKTSNNLIKTGFKKNTFVLLALPTGPEATDKVLITGFIDANQNVEFYNKVTNKVEVKKFDEVSKYLKVAYVPDETALEKRKITEPTSEVAPVVTPEAEIKEPDTDDPSTGAET